eukprot:1069144-Pleurochrysis_carterae.AAC.2
MLTAGGEKLCADLLQKAHPCASNECGALYLAHEGYCLKCSPLDEPCCTRGSGRRRSQIMVYAAGGEAGAWGKEEAGLLAASWMQKSLRWSAQRIGTEQSVSLLFAHYRGPAAPISEQAGTRVARLRLCLRCQEERSQLPVAVDPLDLRWSS